jgi:hypothetical protein
MCSFWIRIGIRPRRIAAAAAGLVSCWLLLPAPLAFAQDAAPPPAVAPAPAPKPSTFEAIGRWFDQGATNFRDHLRGAKRKMDDLSEDAAANNKGFSENAAKVGQGAADVGKGAADATKNAMDAVAKLPTARMMSGRERCANAPNGAPDCLAAAEALCRKHGFSSGKSMDFTSAEECPVKTLLGQAQECTTVTFISRAMCQ